MCNGEVDLRVLDGQWYWFHVDSNGSNVCQSRRSFKSRGSALDDYDNCKADYMALLRCRNRFD